MPNPSYVQTGTVNGSPILVDVANGLGSDGAVSVTLTADYILARPPGYPTRPAMTGTDPANSDYAGRVIPSGTSLGLLPPEAAALVNAGAATYD